MITLKMDVDRFVRDYAVFVADIANVLAQEALNDMRAEFSNSKARTNNEIEEANYSTMVDYVITATVVNKIYAILDSYGTGSKMDKTNEFLDEYMDSKYWNKSRSKTNPYIAGRPKGPYDSLVDNDATSSGVYKGVNLEKSNLPITAQEPSYAIQNAEEVFFTSRINKRLDEKIVPWINANAYKYFYN